MKMIRAMVLWLNLGAGVLTHAHGMIHRYQLGEVSYEYIQAPSSQKRCLEWSSIEDTQPSLEYTREGTLYTKVRIRARASQACALSFEPASRVEVERQGQDVVFSFTVLPPVSTFLVRSGSVLDKVIVEAPARKLEELGAFNFFRDSQIYFEGRWAQFSTDNPDVAVSKRKKNLFPIAGGKINIPFPWWRNLSFGLEMQQNISNFAKQQVAMLNYSEATFDLRLQFVGDEDQGRPLFAAVTNYRGRNVVQRGVANTDAISLNFVSAFGGGLDFMSFSPQDWFGGDSLLSSLGLESSFRYEKSGARYTSLQYNLGMLYRINRRWALSVGHHRLGYALTSVTTSGGSTIHERMNSWYLRLHIMPLMEIKTGGQR